MTDMQVNLIDAKTRLYHDAPLGGEDYYEFIIWFSHRFKVNLKGMNLAELAPADGINPFFPPRPKYKELDLERLAQLSECNSWEESGMAQMLPES